MLKIGIVVFPDVEELDFVGPFEIVSYINKLRPQSTSVRIISNSTEPVRAFNGLKVIPDVDFKSCPMLDILVIPGGKGRMKAMHDLNLRTFLKRQSAQAAYTTSVCTGAFILAEAGLLNGKKATTYHTALDELAAYESIEVKKNKVVHDDKVITSAGVSSGIELGLYLLKLLFGKEMSQQVADKIEYEIDVAEL